MHFWVQIPKILTFPRFWAHKASKFGSRTQSAKSSSAIIHHEICEGGFVVIFFVKNIWNLPPIPALLWLLWDLRSWSILRVSISEVFRLDALSLAASFATCIACVHWVLIFVVLGAILPCLPSLAPPLLYPLQIGELFTCWKIHHALRCELVLVIIVALRELFLIQGQEVACRLVVHELGHVHAGLNQRSLLFRCLDIWVMLLHRLLWRSSMHHVVCREGIMLGIW